MTLSPKRPFGLTITEIDAAGISKQALSVRRTDAQGVGLVVTPNIDHIALLNRSVDFARAYANAAVTVCDGWPVQLYARACGVQAGRVTGCEIASRLMREASQYPGNRLFFVIDAPETAAALHAWAKQHHLEEAVASFIPPFGFDTDTVMCRSLAERIRAHETTILFMAVGAPRSEIFVDRYRSLLPPAWAFCVGQAVKVELGLVQRAPAAVQQAGMEWLWRVAQEPGRLTGRYARASAGFIRAMIHDQRNPHPERREPEKA